VSVSPGNSGGPVVDNDGVSAEDTRPDVRIAQVDVRVMFSYPPQDTHGCGFSLQAVQRGHLRVELDLSGEPSPLPQRPCRISSEIAPGGVLVLTGRRFSAAVETATAWCLYVVAGDWPD
jgi:hypothetical protein